MTIGKEHHMTSAMSAADIAPTAYAWEIQATGLKVGVGRKRMAVDGLPILADKGYIGAGILLPVLRPKGRSEQALHTDTRTTNSLIRGIRALGERAAAEIKQRRRTLQHVTLSPSRIGDIARAALALNEIWR
ncbi:transposase family protein [Streptomyces incanus]|uniref:Transposase family protein n=1 Tax=Streptomyces incanus TaxID=887453 RepID=A0ABW0XVG0_9ACTN